MKNKIVDSSLVQMQSLMCFANSLGYMLFNKIGTNPSFGRISLDIPEEYGWVSFNSMVSMHNCGNFMGKFNNIPQHRMDIAKRNKIVKVVKMNLSKKSTTINIQNHLVEFVDKRGIKLLGK